MQPSDIYFDVGGGGVGGCGHQTFISIVGLGVFIGVAVGHSF